MIDSYRNIGIIVEPEVSNGIKCKMNISEDSTSGSIIIGEAIANVSAFGNVLTPVEITIDVPVGYDPGQYKWYSCFLDQLGFQDGGWMPFKQASDSACQQSWDSLGCAKSGTTFVDKFEGTIE